MLTSILLNKNVRKKKNFFSRGINNGGQRFLAFTYACRTINLLVATVAVVLGLGAFHFLGSGFYQSRTKARFTCAPNCR